MPPPAGERRERARRRRGDRRALREARRRGQGSPRAPRRGRHRTPSVVADLGAHPAAPRVISALVPKLVAHVRAAVDSGDAAKNTGAAGDVSGDCLDVLHAAVSSGGAALAAVADDRIVSPLLAYLAESGRHGARKRAVACLAALAANVSDATLASVADAASSKLAPLADAGASHTDSARDDASLYANLLGASAKSAGRRFGRHADAAMPSLLALCASAEEEGCETLREECLRAMELFAATCADDAGISRRLPDAVDLALRLCSFDPNYDDDDDEEEEGDANGGEEMDAEDDDGYSDDDEGYSDVDDDASWKVRRGAARVLAAVAAASPATLEARFEPTVAKLLARLGEREESVKLDVFAALEEAFRAAWPREAPPIRSSPPRKPPCRAPPTRRRDDSANEAPPKRQRRRRSVSSARSPRVFPAFVSDDGGRRRAGRRRRRRRRRVGRIRIRIRIHERSFDRRVRVDGRGRGGRARRGARLRASRVRVASARRARLSRRRSRPRCVRRRPIGTIKSPRRRCARARRRPARCARWRARRRTRPSRRGFSTRRWNASPRRIRTKR